MSVNFLLQSRKSFFLYSDFSLTWQIRELVIGNLVKVQMQIIIDRYIGWVHAELNRAYRNILINSILQFRKLNIK